MLTNKMSEISLVFLFLLSAALSIKAQPVNAGPENFRGEGTDNVEPVTVPVKQSQWKSTADGVKWLHDCDFPGYDIEYRFMPIEKSHVESCSQACIDTSGCNAFRWYEGWCYLKNVAVTPLSRMQVNDGTCGFLPWEFH